MTKTDEIEAAKLYLDEWKHRDKVYNKHTFTYFCAILVISVFPYIKFTDFSGDKLNSIFQPFIFHLVAIILSIVAMCVSFALGKRLTWISEKYDETLGYIDKKYIHKKEKSAKVVSILSFWLFAILIVFNLVFLFI